MKNQTMFRELVKKNRKALRAAGFPFSTISMWQHGHRRPRKTTAKRLAKVLGVPLEKIPYTYVGIND